MIKEVRPDFADIQNGAEFNQWYWLKAEMVDICKAIGLPYTGGKFLLRDRIMFALDNDGAILPNPPKRKKISKFNWARESLHLETVITDSVSFGPNFRGFMQAQLGPQFTCHSDFMDWVKANPGKTLADAVTMWRQLEDRKNDPQFQREIAAHNMLSQYVRDFQKDNPELSFKDALGCWKLKRRQPMQEGRVMYESTDLEL